MNSYNQRIKILNSEIDNLTISETVFLINQAIKNKNSIRHVVVNAAKIVALQDDLDLRENINSCNIINADGQSVVWASRVLGQPLKERVTGIDLMESLVKQASKHKYKIFFFGATQEIVEKVVDKYGQKYSTDIIAGFRNGYFKETNQEEIAQHIVSSGANILFVAISSPRKENFLYQNRDVLKKINFVMGVGGSFDVIAGKVKRAPNWMQQTGLEWFYRLLQEPRRMWRRYLVGNTKFIFLVIKEFLMKNLKI